MKKVVGVILFCAACCGAFALSVDSLRCEYLNDPAGIDETLPRLSWKLKSELRGERQTAYRILVASSRKLLDEGKGDLWDSGRVAGGETVNVP